MTLIFDLDGSTSWDALKNGNTTTGSDIDGVRFDTFNTEDYHSQSFTISGITFGSALVAPPSSFYWDGGIVDIVGAGDSASTGGAGTWNTTTENWDDFSDHVAWNNSNSDTAIFGGAAGGDVTLGTNITAGGLVFDTAGYLIKDNGGSETLTIGGTGQITTNADAEISATVVGTSGLTKAGTGTLTLSGDNTFTGGLTINDGEVILGNAGALNDTSGSENGVTVNSGGTLSLNGNNILVPTLSGSGTIQNGNAGTTASLTLTNAGTLLGTIQDGAGSAALKLVKTGSGTLQMAAPNSFSGGLDLNDGILLIGDNGGYDGDLSLGTGTLTFTGNAELKPDRNANPTLANTVVINNGVIADINAINQYYDIYLDGPVNGSGTLRVDSTDNGNGIIQFRNSANGFTGELRIGDRSRSGVTLTVKSLADSSNPIKFYENGSRLILGSGTASSLNFLNRQIVLVGGTNASIINNSNDGKTITIAQDLVISSTGNKALTLAGFNGLDNTFSGDIANGNFGGGTQVVSFIKDDGGKWILSGNNTYTGDTTVSDGTLEIGGAGVLGGGNYAGTISIGAGDTLTFSSSADQRLSGTISSSDANGKLNFSGIGLVSVTGNAAGFQGTVNATGPVDLKGTMGAKAITVGNNGVLDIGKGTVGSLTLADGSTLTFGDGSTWNIDIASATSFDKIVSNNSTVILPAEGQISININFTGKAEYLQTYTIFDGTLAGAVFTPSMFVLPEGWGITEGSLILISYIPEPSTMVLAGLGLAGLTFRRRRRSA